MNAYHRRLGWLLLPAFLAGHPAYGQIDPTDPLEERRQEERQRQLESDAPVISIAPGERRAPLTPETPCFEIETISVVGSTLLDETTLRATLGPFAGACLGMEGVNAVIHDLGQAFIDAGFVTTRAYVPEQDVTDGTLDVMVVEGVIEDLSLVRAGRNRPFTAFRLVPAREGDVLQVDALETALKRLSRLRSSNLDIGIEPGDETGGSVVRIVDDAEDAFRLNVGYGAGGAVSATLETDDMLRLYEDFALILDGTETSNSIATRLGVPIRSSTIRLSGSYSEQSTALTDFALLLDRTKRLAADFDMPVVEADSADLSITAGLDWTQTRRFVNDAELTPQRLTSATFGVSGSYRGDGYAFGGALTAHQGLEAFGAADTEDQPSDAPSVTYRLAEGSLTHLRNLGPLRLVNTVRGQYTEDILYSSRRFSLGGASAVRGVPGGFASGDRGIALQNTLEWRIDGPGPAFPLLGTLAEDVTASLLADAGTVEDLASDRFTSAASVGIGLTVGGSRLSVDLSYDVPFSLDGRSMPDDDAFEFKVTYKLL